MQFSRLNLNWSLVLVLLAGIIEASRYGHCAGRLRVRKEFYDLTIEELGRLINAMIELKKKPAEVFNVRQSNAHSAESNIEKLKAFKNRIMQKPKLSFDDGRLVSKIHRKMVENQLMLGLTERWMEYVSYHGDLVDFIHMDAVFLPWHRQFIYEFETELRAIDPSVTLPYWAWSYEAFDVRGANVLSSSFFGTSENYEGSEVPTDVGLPIPDGPFKHWKTELPMPDYIKRGYFFDKPLKMHGRNCFDKLDNSTMSWGEFAYYLEHFHNYGHNSIGGTMSDTAFSPPDPTFFLHHAYMDYAWDHWQNLRGNTERFKFYQVPQYREAPLNRQDASPSDELPGYSGIRVRDVLNSASMCVRYAEPKKIHARYRQLLKKTKGEAYVAFPEYPSDFFMGLNGVVDPEFHILASKAKDSICDGYQP